MYSVQCTVYSVQRTVLYSLNEHCAVYSVLCTVNNVTCIVYCVHPAVTNVSLQYIFWRVHYTKNILSVLCIAHQYSPHYNALYWCTAHCTALQCWHMEVDWFLTTYRSYLSGYSLMFQDLYSRLKIVLGPFIRGTLETLFIIHRAKLLPSISPHPMHQQGSPCFGSLKWLPES